MEGQSPASEAPVVLPSAPIVIAGAATHGGLREKSQSQKGKPASPSAPPAKPQTAITGEERATFIMALQTLSELADQGLWYLGLDTDPDTPTMEGMPGVAIWTMDNEEAMKVADSFIVLSRSRKEVLTAIRTLNQAHAHLMAGVIIGSRFFRTGMALFEQGINFRMTSKSGWTKMVKEHAANG